MGVLTVPAKGQVTLRKDVLQHLGIHAGDKIEVNKLLDGRIEVKAAKPRGRISDTFNFLKRADNPTLSIEQIGRLAAEGGAAKR